MDVKEHLGQFLSDKGELSDVQNSTVEQLKAIFSQFNRKTLEAVVKYQSYFNPPGSIVLQHCIDFILDNNDIINDLEIEVICIDAYDIIGNKMDESKRVDEAMKTEDTAQIVGSNISNKAGETGMTNSGLKGNDDSISTFSNLPDSPELQDEVNINNNFAESKKSKGLDEIDHPQKDQSIPCIDLDSLPAIDFPARRSQSLSRGSKDKVDKEITEISAKSHIKDKTLDKSKSFSDNAEDQKAPCTNSGTCASFTVSPLPKNNSNVSQSLGVSPVKALTNNFQLAVSHEVYLQWKIEHKKKLAEKYSKSLKLLRSLTPNPEAEIQLRQAYEEKLRLVETGQKLPPRHLLKPKTDGEQNVPSPNFSAYLKNYGHDQFTPQEKTDNTSTPNSKLIGSSLDSSISTVPGVNSLICKSPDIKSPSSQQVNNTSFSEFVNRIVSENKHNTGIRSKANFSDTTDGSSNSSRFVSSITSIEDKDNVVTVVNTITISPTINSVIYSGESDISVSTTNSASSICDKTNLGLDKVEKPPRIVNVFVPNGNNAVNKRTAGQLPYFKDKGVSSPGPFSNSKHELLKASPIGAPPGVKGLTPATAITVLTSNYQPQSTASLSRINSAPIIRPSSFPSTTSTPTRSNSTPISVKKGQYQLSKKSTPSATITSGGIPDSLTTKSQALKALTPSRLSWTSAGASTSTSTPTSTRTPLVISTTSTPVHQELTTRHSFTPTIIPGVAGSISSASTLPIKSTTPSEIHQVLTTRHSFTPTIVPGVASAKSSAKTYTPSKSAIPSSISAVTTTANRFDTSRNYSPTISQGTYNTVSNQNTSSTTTSTPSTKTISSSIPSTPTTSSITMSSKKTKRSEVLQLFPDADPKYIDELLSMFTGETAVNNVCSTLIDNPSYPRVKRTEVIVISPSPDKNKEDGKIDYYTAYITKEYSCPYFREALDMLSNDFKMISVRDITAVMYFYKNYYAPAHKALSLAFQSAMQKNNDPMKKIESVEVKLIKNDKVEVRHCRLLKNRRTSYRISPKLCLEFKKELEFVANMIAKEKVNADAEVARKLNEAQYTEAGDNIECGCCYGEQPFEDMVQCYDGHLFCKSCLQSYVREAVFGSGKLDLRCMTEGCDSNFPESQLQCCLETDVLEKYQERVREENLNLADLEDLVRCPNCEYAAIMDSGDKVFRCQNIHCLKETCRFCKEEWKDHIGIPCEELEKKDEAALRKEYEEKMTAAKVRTCHKCKSQFMKEEGCNKMTCRCGATMCYVCRKPSIHYNHFCQHPRDPGSDCKKCKACSLWSNPEEDDQRAVAEIQQEAQKKRREKGFVDDKLIGGTTSEPPAKKARKK